MVNGKLNGKMVNYVFLGCDIGETKTYSYGFIQDREDMWSVLSSQNSQCIALLCSSSDGLCCSLNSDYIRAQIYQKVGQSNNRILKFINNS